MENKYSEAISWLKYLRGLMNENDKNSRISNCNTAIKSMEKLNKIEEIVYTWYDCPTYSDSEAFTDIIEVIKNE